MTFKIQPLAPAVVAETRTRPVAGDPRVVRVVAASSPGYPCRRYLRDAAVGEAMLLFPHTPFASESPYVETGAILAHEAECAPPTLAPGEVPEVTRVRANCVVRAYDGRDWIHDGKLVDSADAAATIAAFFADAAVARVHVRNVGYGCFAYEATRA
jgi:hypothetical protein